MAASELQGTSQIILSKRTLRSSPILQSLYLSSGKT